MRITSVGLIGLLCGVGALSAQTPGAGLEPVPAIAWTQDDPLAIRGAALPNHPFTVTLRSGAILGMQDGVVELWQLPVKFFSGMRLRAEVEGYPVPIELNPLAAEFEVSPDHTTLTYSHAAVRVRQHMFVPASDADAPGGVDEGVGGQILFEIAAIHPVTLVVSLTPALVEMWPAPQWGQPGWGWQAIGGGGAYAVGTDNPRVFGMIGMPGAVAGVASPYQEHPRTLPMEFRVQFDPARDAGKLFPLLCAVGRPGEVNDAAGQAAVRARLVATNAALPGMYARTRDYYAHFFDHRLVAHTPEAAVDRALAWAELSIEKSQATIPAHGDVAAETGLVAGWFPSFDSARPGFGWFFGRDTLWSMYAINSEGDGALARRALGFLMRRQRADGKMPHEFSQTAEELTGEMAWDKLPYEYAAADATPLFLLAMQDYVRATGDVGFLKAHWEAVAKAYAFERGHDSDGDGVYDNSQGTGWVEDWPVLPHQELYLAALDRDATRAMVTLAGWAGHAEVGAAAAAVAPKLEAAVAAYQAPNGMYAFSKNVDGSYDRTSTVYPAVAFWSSGTGLPASEAQLEAWAGHGFATDWGTRAVAETDPAYDPISYHRGTVWPLFTGWAATAMYRTGHPVAGWSALRENLGLTWAGDPGAVTEVLSGAFYEPLGRSSTHQMWSSAMALAPAVRAMFGVEVDAPRRTLMLHPHLPPEWDGAVLEHVRVGPEEYRVAYRREGGVMRVTATGAGPTVLCLVAADAVGEDCRAPAAATHTLAVPLPGLEVSLVEQGMPLPGAATMRPHVVAETYGARETAVVVEGMAGTEVVLRLRLNGAGARGARTADGEIRDGELRVRMPAGEGWVRKTAKVGW